MLVALILILFAQTDDLLQNFHIETIAFRFGEDFLLPFVERLDLFLDMLNCARRMSGCGRPRFPRYRSCMTP